MLTTHQKFNKLSYHRDKYVRYELDFKNKEIETGDFKVLDERAPRIAVANWYRTQFDLEPAALWHPIDGYDGTISGIVKAMPLILDGLQDMVRRVLVEVQERLRAQGVVQGRVPLCIRRSQQAH